MTINQSFVNPSVTKKPYCREDLGKSRLLRALALINVLKKAIKDRGKGQCARRGTACRGAESSVTANEDKTEGSGLDWVENPTGGRCATDARRIVATVVVDR